MFILIYLKDPALHLAEKLDEKDFSEGFSFIWNQWTSKPYVKVEGLGWLFKLFLWCLRYISGPQYIFYHKLTKCSVF